MSIKVREKKLGNGNSSLYLDIYVNKRRVYEFLDIHLLKGEKETNKSKLRQANEIRATRELDIANNNYNLKSNKTQRTNFFDYSEHYISDKNSGRKGTFKCLLHHIEKHHSSKKLCFNEIDKLFIENFKSYLLDQVPVSKNSAYIYMLMFKQLFNQALKNEIISNNPFDKIDMIKTTRAQKYYLTFEELKKLNKEDCFNGEVKRAFLFSCFSGLRLGDIRNLTWREIQNGNIDIVQEKTQEQNIIKLSKTALELIGEPDEADTKIFKLPPDYHLGIFLKAWIHEAKITKKITFHSARHTFATMNLTFGADLFTVSKLMGHSNIRSTQVYAKLIDKKKNQAIDALPVL